VVDERTAFTTGGGERQSRRGEKAEEEDRNGGGKMIGRRAYGELVYSTLQPFLLQFQL
jgi:hypothetical protein